MFAELKYLFIFDHTKNEKDMKTYSKKQPKAYVPRFLSNGLANPVVSEMANTEKEIAKRAAKSAVMNTRVSWENEDGSRNWDKYNDFLEERQKAAWGSKSF